MKKIKIISLLLMVICFAGCKKDTITNPSNSNIPVVANTTNAFSFSLAATSFTSNVEYNLSFLSDSLACSIVVANQTLGNGSLTILDSNNTTVFSNAPLSNQVTAFIQANKGIPKKINLTFNNYTGTIVFALSKNNGNNK